MARMKHSEIGQAHDKQVAENILRAAAYNLSHLTHNSARF